MSRANATASLSRIGFRKWPLEWAGAAVFVLGGLLSFLAAYIAKDAGEKTYRLQFERTAYSYTAALESHIRSNLSELYSLADFFQSSYDVTRDEFRSFVSSILSRHDTSIQALEWAPRIQNKDREEFEQWVGKGGLTGFQITERLQNENFVRSGTRPEYFPVLYVEPLENNRSLPGFDIASDHALQPYLTRARDSGETLISEFAAKPDNNKFYMFHPLYNDSAADASVDFRRVYLRGFIIGVFNIVEIVEHSKLLESDNKFSPHIYLRIYDVTAPSYKKLIYPKSDPSPYVGPESTLWTSAKQLTIADRTWSIELSLDTSVLSVPPKWIFGLTFAGGLIASGLLAALLVVLIRSSRKSWIAANTIRESEQQQRNMLNNTSSVIFTKDLQGRYTFINRAYEEKFGISDEQITGKTDYDLFAREIADELYSHDIKALASDKPMEFEEIIPLAGFTYIYLTSRFPLKHLSGEAYALCGISTDITERRNFEIQLRRTQKMDAIGQLTGGIAHDFNNILAIIQGNTDLLELQMDDKAEVLERVKSIKHATKRASDLTRQLLGFSRDTVKKIEIVDINRIIAELESLIARAVTPQVIVEHHFAEGLWLTEIDPGDFQNALLNLIFNARDAMGSRGRLILETRNRTLDSSYSSRNFHVEEGDYVELSVSDTGTGMPAEVLENIFEPFYTTKDVGKGTGLGLSMVYGFVKRSKGAINVYSEVGTGTTFKIYLPRSDKSTGQNKLDQPNKNTIPRGTETILIVDDEKGLLDIAKKSMTELGYNVLTAENGQQALEILEEKPSIDLLVSDVVMPGGINGYELASRAVKQYPRLRILLASGYTDKVSGHKETYPLQASVLAKPYTREELAQRIRDLLDEKDL